MNDGESENHQGALYTECFLSDGFCNYTFWSLPGTGCVAHLETPL